MSGPSDTPNMDSARVLALIEAHGADARRWPEVERDAMARAIAADPARYAEALAAGRRLDAALNTLAVPAMAPDLFDRIETALPARAGEGGRSGVLPRPRMTDRLLGMIFGPRGLAAGAASLALGVMVGVSYGSAAAAQAEIEQIWDATGFDSPGLQADAEDWTAEDAL